MNIQRKLILGAVILGFLPIFIGAIFIGQRASSDGDALVRKQVQQQLTAVREITAEKVEHYFKTIENQIVTMSNSRMVIDAIQDFEGVFEQHAADLRTDVSDINSSLTSFYKDQFNAKYQATNPNSAFDGMQALQGLSPAAKALQYTYIGNNPNPLGEKDKLLHAQDYTAYTKIHAYYHEAFHEFLNRFGYYDIFLVSLETGEVVYSVYKELDFATSLLDGPYAQSGLAQAFRAIKDANEPSAVALTDFAPYTPSYEAPASFIASPIYDVNEKVGVLIFQMPIDRLNEIMTHKQTWSDIGLGDTGETYLVGPDFNMRSLSRFLIEDKDGYFDLLKSIGLSDGTIDRIRQQNTSVGLQPVKTLGSEEALSGKTGYSGFEDYRGVPVFSAYRPIEVRGFRWALMSEIDQAEAFVFSNELTSAIWKASIITIVIALFAAAISGWLFSKSIITPILRTVNMLKNIAKGDGDLTQRLDDSSGDEMGQLASWFNQFISDIQNLVADLNKTIETLNQNASEFRQDSTKAETAIEAQNQMTQQISHSMAHLRSVVEEITRHSDLSADLAANTASASTTGLEVVKACTQAIENLSTDIQHMVDSINSLSDSSKKVEEVVSVIQAIAEQTNLLALNAAIEAARAGESGRGFAVVADEVRNLAQRTQDSTSEIGESISMMTQGISRAVELADNSNNSVQQGLGNAKEAEETFQSINSSVLEIQNTGAAIKDAAQQQSQASDEVNSGIVSIDNGAKETTKLVSAIATRSGELATMGQSLKQTVSRYRT